MPCLFERGDRSASVPAASVCRAVGAPAPGSSCRPVAPGRHRTAPASGLAGAVPFYPPRLSRFVVAIRSVQIAVAAAPSFRRCLAASPAAPLFFARLIFVAADLFSARFFPGFSWFFYDFAVFLSFFVLSRKIV